MEDSANSSLKSSLASVSAKALNCSSRQILSSNLDYKQLLPSGNGYFRDYRGLAELIGFQYNIIKRFGELETPTMKILESWETRPDATLDKLIDFLEEMERHDVINELSPSLEKDVKNYTRYQKSLESPIQVAEVTSGPMNLYSGKNQPLTISDLRSGECTIYDAYVSYADEDSHIVAEFSNHLESPSLGLKLFIRGRDMLAGFSELDTNIEMIKNRCRRMLILLTPNFLRSPSLEFQVNFASTLAIEQRQRILVPVVLTPCEVPIILHGVSKIDFTKNQIQEWMWDKLIISLLPEDRAGFLSNTPKNPTSSRNMITNTDSSNPADSKPVITLPETAKFERRPMDNSSPVLSIIPVDTSDDEMKELDLCNGMKELDSCNEMKDSHLRIEVKESDMCSEVKQLPARASISPSKKRRSFLSFLRRKGNSSNANSSNANSSNANSSNANSSASFSSGATSGFHSQSWSDLRSCEKSNEKFACDTSL